MARSSEEPAGHQHQSRSPNHPHAHEQNHKKRKHRTSSAGSQAGMSHSPSKLHQPDLPEFNLTSKRRSSHDAEPPLGHAAASQDWQTAENGRAKKKAKKIPKQNSSNYPAIEFSESSRLNSQIKISDLQQLVLYILADGSSPHFVAVRHRPEIRKVVVLMIPGLEYSAFEKENGPKRHDKNDRSDSNHVSPDDYFPLRLKLDKLPISVQAFADMFSHVWPVKTPGDDKYAKMHSPLHAMLTAPLTKSKEDKNWNKNKKGATPVKEPHDWKNTRTPIPQFIHTPEDLLENDYTLHPASYDTEAEKIALEDHRRSNGVSKDDGWVDSEVEKWSDGTPPDTEIQAGSLTAGREVLAMDCEMCMTGENEFSLTRISIVTWDGSVILDELVKPEKPIINYLTQYSGITEVMLAPVTTTLQDIQQKLLKILTPQTILLGHSLNSDLTALKITHPFIIDTALLFPHPRGPPLKSSLKWLAQRYLNREIQKGHGTTGPGAGHDSIEDARTCLDLVKQKCEKGKEWGTSDAQGENLFKRIARAGVKYKSQGGSAIPSPLDGKSSAAVDWGDPKKGPGAAASFAIGCKSDEEVMEGVIRAVKGDSDGKEIPGGGVDFIWARFRELEALKGWWNNNKIASSDATATPSVAVDAGSSNSTNEDKPSTEPAVSVAAMESTTSTSIASSSLPPPVNLDASTSQTTATAALTQRISKIYDSLPPCTALVVYSGSGDPCEMGRLQAMQTQFKREYKIKKWDELSVKWTDVEEQALRRAVRVARGGIGFVTVK